VARVPELASCAGELALDGAPRGPRHAGDLGVGEADHVQGDHPSLPGTQPCDRVEDFALLEDRVDRVSLLATALGDVESRAHRQLAGPDAALPPGLAHGSAVEPPVGALAELDAVDAADELAPGIDGMCRGLSWRTGRDLLSSSAARVRAGISDRGA
jgi:hypothetical protein